MDPGLGQGEVPGMLRAVWRAQPGRVESPSHIPGEGEGKQSLVADWHSPKLSPRVKIPSERQVLFPWLWGTRAAEQLGCAAPQANSLLGCFLLLSLPKREEEEEEASLLTRGNRTKKKNKQVCRAAESCECCGSRVVGATVPIAGVPVGLGKNTTKTTGCSSES